MAVVAILVNGASGPTREGIGAALAELLGCPVLGRDAVARSLTGIAGPMIQAADLDRIARATTWSMAGAIENGVVLEDSWRPSRDRADVVAGLAVAGGPRVVELYCVDGAGDPDDEGPLDVGPVVRLDVATPVDVPALVQRLAALF